VTTRSPSEPLRIDFSHALPATWGLVGCLLVVHAAGALAATGRLSLVESLVVARPLWLRVALGGQHAPLVDAGQWWRLGTSVWVHAGLLHVLLNSAALAALGRVLEPWMGSARLVAWFAVGGAGASLASHLAGLVQSDGASGGVFALLGAAVAIGVRRRAVLDPRDRWVVGPALWLTTLANLVLGIAVPQIDAVAHVAGLGIGLVLGAGLEPGPRTSGFVAGAFLIVCVWGWTVGLP